MSKSDDNDPTMFPEKWLKKLPTGFSEDADSMSEADLKKTIVSCENNIFTIEKEKSEDVKLTAAQEIAQILVDLIAMQNLVRMPKSDIVYICCMGRVLI